MQVKANAMFVSSLIKIKLSVLYIYQSQVDCIDIAGSRSLFPGHRTVFKPLKLPFLLIKAFSARFYFRFIFLGLILLTLNFDTEAVFFLFILFNTT